MLLITGITGHSGRYFFNELNWNNYQGKIRCIVRRGSDIDFLNKSDLDIELVYGDLTDKKFVNESMVNIDTVIHIASIFYSENLVEAAINNNVRRAIFVHTTGIFSKYKSASVEYKEIEDNIYNMIKEKYSTLGLTILRPTMIYGNVNDKNMAVFIKMVDKLKIFPVINNGEGLLQPVNGKDLGKAYYLLLMKKDILSGDYILSGENAISMKDLFKMIGDILGKRTIFINVPLKFAQVMALCLKGITFGKIDYVEKVLRMGENRNFSHERAKIDFEYTPMSLKDGLKIEIEQYKRL